MTDDDRPRYPATGLTSPTEHAGAPKIEHRLFSYISINWRAKPLVSRQTVIDLIASTATSTGLKVYARLDPHTYPSKLQITDQQMQAVNITGEEFHPDWNYTITKSVIKT